MFRCPGFSGCRVANAHLREVRHRQSLFAGWPCRQHSPAVVFVLFKLSFNAFPSLHHRCELPGQPQLHPCNAAALLPRVTSLTSHPVGQWTHMIASRSFFATADL